MNSFADPFQLEALESRQLLSSAILSDSVLRVRASKSGNNVLEAIASPGGGGISIRVNGAYLGTWKVSDVNQVRMYAGTGNDLLEVIAQRRAFVTYCVMFGGPGNDTLIGGSGNQLMVGGTGDIVYDLGLGNDTVVGGSGNCTINGGAGTDLIYSGSGNDTIYGGNNGSVIFGQGGNDDIFGGLHSNFICGGTGEDYIDGGPGQNIIYGGGNRHTVIVPGGAHTFSTASVMPGLVHYMIKLYPKFAYD